MKLLAKTSFIYLFTTLFVFAIGGVVFYYNLRKIVDMETTERLFTEKSQVEDYVKAHDTIPGNSFTSEDFIEFQITPKPVIQTINDTTLFSKEEGEDLPFRQLLFPIKVKQNNYSVLVSKNLFEKDDLVEAILYSFLTIIGVLLIVTIAVNRIAAGKLLKPFFKTVDQLSEFNIDEKKSIRFSKTSTKEFIQLNVALEKMTDRIFTDYHNLKAFTENASHELQTPLSIILTSTEQLLQEKNLNEKQSVEIQRINQTARKLSKLNQTLLLLAKIENRQFENRETLNVAELINNKLEFFSELISHKEISLQVDIDKSISVELHPILADILVSNLITNAIRHNQKGGTILIRATAEKIVFCNSGEPLQSDSKKLFERFYKENNSSESTGLGLALVKQIIDTNGMKINYSHSENLHCFEILLKQN